MQVLNLFPLSVGLVHESLEYRVRVGLPDDPALAVGAATRMG